MLPPLPAVGGVSPRPGSLINRTVNRPPQPLAVPAEEAQGWKTGCGGRRGCQAHGERRGGGRAEESRGEQRGAAGGGDARRRALPWGKTRAPGSAPLPARLPQPCPAPACPPRAAPAASPPHPPPRGPAGSSEPRLLSCPISWASRGRHRRRLRGSAGPSAPAVPPLPG